MKEPIARPVTTKPEDQQAQRAPRAFSPVAVAEASTDPFAPTVLPEDVLAPPRRKSIWTRLAWGTGGVLVSLGLGLAAERLIRDLFDRYEWLGWAGTATLALFVLAVIVLACREIFALRRLRVLDTLRLQAISALATDRPAEGRPVMHDLLGIYAHRADLAQARKALTDDSRDMLDGAEFIRLSERTLMPPLDARAKALTAASARRVALVTAVSPRALVDVAFVAYESFRLAGAIARLYGGKPGFFGSWRLVGAVLSHLAVTGGLAMSDGVVEQLVGHGLAARLSQRLGEGLVNGLMTVRVGIAAMRVVRPLPYDTQRQPIVRDFIPELANVAGGDGKG